MSDRRKAMNPNFMKKGGMAKHDDAAQDRAMIKKAMAGKKFATGGVALGQGGYKDGGKVYSKGIIPESVSAKGAGPYRNTEMHTAEYTGKSSGKTGGVKNGNGGGYATGGVALGNGGGYKMGGKASKKAYATGGTVDSGKPVAMPQGSKKPPTPVSINRLSGTYKSGGKVTPAEGRLRANFAAENATAM
jgi:hypothetical protein